MFQTHFLGRERERERERRREKERERERERERKKRRNGIYGTGGETERKEA